MDRSIPQPSARSSEADERARYLTVVFRAPKGWKPGDEILYHPNFSAASWSHALDDRDAARRERDVAMAAASRQGAPEAPDGFVLAPMIPTDEMCVAAREKVSVGANYADHIYRAMVAVVPTPTRQAAPLCRWPLCQPEEVQQRIAKEVVDALYGDPGTDE